jgi:hypothetical protein
MSDARMSLVVGQKRVILEAATVRASSLSTGPAHESRFSARYRVVRRSRAESYPDGWTRRILRV